MRPALMLVESTQGVWVPRMVLHGAGSGASAVLLAQMLYLFRQQPDGTLVMADSAWHESTGLSPDQVTRARKALVDTGLITCGKQRVEGSMTTVYSLDLDGLDSMVEAVSSATSRSRYRDSRSRESATSSFLPTDVELLPIGSTPKATRGRSTPLPDVFVVTDDMRAWAAANVPSVDVDNETEQFRDHHRAKGSTFRDWPAAWRTWMRNAVRFAGNGNGARPDQPTVPRAWAAIDRARRRG